MKILLILGLILSFFLLLFALGIRFIKGILKPFTGFGAPKQARTDKSKEIIYQKDDIVIMKGDADNSTKS
ncbi:MAG: hypothetical protein CVV22_12005 [Ignavibacteriae bacterium HGW-Ignavibacteriae-1]|nr:MAG: hypothetical protein CVV22_12005 [Ignavibacteriae bacterium HGW-Ignavibacteriae-1]